jgi:hypothetical protein
MDQVLSLSFLSLSSWCAGVASAGACLIGATGCGLLVWRAVVLHDAVAAGELATDVFFQVLDLVGHMGTTHGLLLSLPICGSEQADVAETQPLARP